MQIVRSAEIDKDVSTLLIKYSLSIVSFSKALNHASYIRFGKIANNNSKTLMNRINKQQNKQVNDQYENVTN